MCGMVLQSTSALTAARPDDVIGAFSDDLLSGGGVFEVCITVAGIGSRARKDL